MWKSEYHTVFLFCYPHPSPVSISSGFMQDILGLVPGVALILAKKDTFLIIVCPYWKLPLEARALKWSCQNTLKQPYSWIMFIFPLVQPCITSSGVFPPLHPAAVKIPIFFASPPAAYMTGGDGISLPTGFSAVSWWWLSARLLHHSSPLSNIFEKGQAFPLCCCCHKKNHSIGVFSSQIHPIPSYFHSTLNRTNYPLPVQTTKSFIFV